MAFAQGAVDCVDALYAVGRNRTAGKAAGAGASAGGSSESLPSKARGASGGRAGASEARGVAWLALDA